MKDTWVESFVKWTILGLLALVGTLLMWVEEEFGLPVVVGHIGIAFWVAAVLGTTIDLWLKRQIVRDVFREAFGYGITPDVQEQIRWLYSQTLKISDYRHEIRFEKIENDGPRAYRIKSTITRKLTNIGQPINVPFSLGIDEWFNQAGTSEITRYAYWSTSGDSYDGKPPPTERSRSVVKIKKEEIPSLKLGKNESCSIMEEYHHVHGDIGFLWFMGRTLNTNPQVSIAFPEGLEGRVEFLCKTKDEKTQVVQGTHVLDGSLLPFQPIIVSWWRKEDADRLCPAIHR